MYFHFAELHIHAMLVILRTPIPVFSIAFLLLETVQLWYSEVDESVFIILTFCE